METGGSQRLSSFLWDVEMNENPSLICHGSGMREITSLPRITKVMFLNQNGDQTGCWEKKLNVVISMHFLTIYPKE